MASVQHSSAFERVFSRGDLFRGPSLRAFLWGLAAAILLFFELLAFYLLVDLSFTRGNFETSLEDPERAAFAQKINAVRYLTAAEINAEEEAAEEQAAEEEQTSEADDEQSDEEIEAEADQTPVEPVSSPPATGESDKAEQGPARFPVLNPALWRSSDAGLLPTAYYNRDRLWGAPLAALYTQLPAFRSNISTIAVLLGFLVVLSLLRTWVLTRHGLSVYGAGLEIATRMRRAIHRQVLRLGPSELDRDQSASAFSLFTTEVERVQGGIEHWVARLSRAPFELFVLLLFAVMLDWEMTFKCVVPVIACLYLVEQANSRARQKRKLAESKAESELRLLAERFEKTRLVRGFRMEDAEHGQFQTLLDRYRSEITQAVRQQSLSFWVSRVMITICIALVLYLILNDIFSSPEDSSLSTSLCLIVAILAMGLPVVRLWRLPGERSTASESASKIFRYQDLTPNVSQAVGAKFLQPLAEAITFRNVSYKDSRTGVTHLSGIDLTIPAKQKTAVVSLDPLQPQTLVSLLPRYLEPTTGQVLFDGEDTAWATLDSLRAEAIVVNADDAFFTGTVSENLMCGDDKLTRQQVTDAAKLVHAHKFLSQLPQGYETVLGEQGELLEPGQSFLLSLARAALRNPALLIIEEPKTPLDEATRELLDDTYNRLAEDRTVIFLPSRLSTLRKATNVVLLHQGKVNAFAPHAQLVQQSALYRHWEYIHFNEFRKSGSSST